MNAPDSAMQARPRATDFVVRGTIVGCKNCFIIKVQYVYGLWF